MTSGASGMAAPVLPDKTANRVWRLMLELRLRKSDGDALQAFFSDVMEAVHGDDFIRVRPQGRIGDKGCDGFLKSTGEVFACHGTHNGAAPSNSSVLSKIKDDFAKAKAKLPFIKKWTYVHNGPKGVSIEVVALLKEFEEKEGIKTAVFGMTRFEKEVMSLPTSVVTTLLGDMITEGTASDVDLREIRDLARHIAASGVLAVGLPESISPVSEKKLEYNDLSPGSKDMLLLGLRNAPTVKAYFDSHSDPMLGNRVAQSIRASFLDLEAQGLSPDEILDKTAEYIGGPDAVFRKFVPTVAILGYFFETCSLLRDMPSVQ